MIHAFIAKQVLTPGAGGNPSDLSLADLLADGEMKQVFESTFAVVSTKATMADVRKAMLAVPGCNDVFVTKNGEREGPVLGWLTNVRITRND